MELAEPGIVSVAWFGLVVVAGGLVMAAISYFSMKETSYEDVLAKQRKEQELAEKEKTRANKQKKEQKKKTELKKKKSPTESSKPPVEADGLSVAREVQIKPSQPVEREAQKVKEPKKKNKQPTPAKPVEEALKPEVAVVKNASATAAKTANQGEQRIKTEKLQKQSAASQEKPKTEKPLKQPPSTKDQAKSRVQQNGIEAAPEVKTKKNKSRQEGDPAGEPLIETVRSTKMDSATVQALMDILSQKSGSGDWYSANSGKNRELQKKLNNKDLEIVQHLEQLAKYKKQIDQLDQAIEVKKRVEMEHEKQINDHVTLEKELRKQQSDDKKQISHLQSQVQNSTESSGNVQKLKEENAILLQTIQANAQSVSEKTRLSQELQTVQNQLKDSDAARTKLERQLSEKNKSTKKIQVDVDSYQKRIDEVTQKLHDAQGSYGKLENEFQKTQSDLQYSQDKCAKLLGQVALLNDANDQRLESLSETKNALEQRLLEMDANDSQKAEEAAKLHTQVKDLKKQVNDLTAKNQALVDEIALQKHSSNKVVDDLQKNSNVLKEKDNSISTLQTSNEEYKEANSKLESEVEKLKKKNNELRERNWKAMDAVAAAEKSAKDKISASKEEMAKASSSLESNVRTELSSNFPEVSCNEKDFKVWFSAFLAQAKNVYTVTSSADNELNEKKIKELEKKNLLLQKETSGLEDRLRAARSAAEKSQSLEKEMKELQQTIATKEADVEKYKNILTSTEGFLSDLQKRVEIEEGEIGRAAEENITLNKNLSEAKKQRDDALKKVEEKTDSLSKLEAECAKLKQQLSETNFALNNAQEKCQEFERHDNDNPPAEMHEVASAPQSSHSSSPFRVALSDVDMNTDMNLVEDDQGFVVVDQPDQSHSIEPQENGQIDEVAKLKERLEKEKALTKNLGNAASKLQSVLKQTQDQLAKEREKNQDLNQQQAVEYTSDLD